jgi:cytosine/adenosine deaminase-related metal-dependent hydrolase
MRALSGQRVWTPSGEAVPATLEIDDDDVIVAVRPRRAGDPSPVPELLVPGFINAHAHLEIGGPQVTGGEGFVSWARALLARNAPRATDQAAAAFGFGTAWLADVRNGANDDSMEAAGLAGVVHQERLGFDERTLPGLLAGVPEVRRRPSGVWELPAAHATFSTAPSLLKATLAPGPGPRRTIHVGESADERQFLTHGDGPHAELLDALGRQWRWFSPPGCGPIHLLDQLSLLGPSLLLVHGVHLDQTEIALIARRSAAVCLCPRSNLHIVGRLPNVPALVQAGIPLAIGTDSAASAPDLDPLGELAELTARWPEQPRELWLAMLTHAGAAAVGAESYGAFVPHTRPGVLALAAASPRDLAGPVDRAWLVRPGGR